MGELVYMGEQVCMGELVRGLVCVGELVCVCGGASMCMEKAIFNNRW